MASDNKAILQLQRSGLWSIVAPGRSPVTIPTGEIFQVEIRRRWWRVQMNAARGAAAAARIIGGQVNRVPIRLRDGQPARFLDRRQRPIKPLKSR
jgi:hypothetical protein